MKDKKEIEAVAIAAITISLIFAGITLMASAGTSQEIVGNVTATLEDNKSIVGATVSINFTVNDTANATAWYNISFPSAFTLPASVGSTLNAADNVTGEINGTTNPKDWNVTNDTLWINVSSTDPVNVSAGAGNTTYINISNITVPATAGGNVYTINVTTNNSGIIQLTYNTVVHNDTVENVPQSEWYWNRNESELWHITTENYHSDTHSWWYGNETNKSYDFGRRTADNLTSRWIDLTDAGDATLSFWTWWYTEVGTTWDKKLVQISTDNTSWTTLYQVHGGNVPKKEWTQVDVSLSDYIHKNVLIRFRFDSGDGQYNNYTGWFIDDINVSVTPLSEADTEPPSSEIVYPHDSDNLTNTTHVIKGTAADDVAVDHVNISIYNVTNESDITEDISTTVNGTTFWWYLWNTSNTSKTTWNISSIAWDKNGNNEAADNVTNITVTINYSAGLPNPRFNDTVEWTCSEEYYWNATSSSNLWHVTTEDSHSGMRSWWYADETDKTYNTGEKTADNLTFNYSINLTGLSSPKLSFWTWWNTEVGTTWDKKLVEVRNTTSSDWTTLYQVHGGNVPKKEWTQVDVNLSDYTHKNVSIRFRFDSVDGKYNDYKGWFIDDIKVYSDNPT